MYLLDQNITNDRQHANRKANGLPKRCPKISRTVLQQKCQRHREETRTYRIFYTPEPLTIVDNTARFALIFIELWLRFFDTLWHFLKLSSAYLSLYGPDRSSPAEDQSFLQSQISSS